MMSLSLLEVARQDVAGLAKLLQLLLGLPGRLVLVEFDQGVGTGFWMNSVTYPPTASPTRQPMTSPTDRP